MYDSSRVSHVRSVQQPQKRKAHIRSSARTHKIGLLNNKFLAYEKLLWYSAHSGMRTVRGNYNNRNGHKSDEYRKLFKLTHLHHIYLYI